MVKLLQCYITGLRAQTEAVNQNRAIDQDALAHSISDKAEAAYRRGDQFEKRRKLMEAWADFCDSTKQGKVVQLRV